MVDSIAFRTKARTIDHLGREQIADCPTAISELWKNSYDAYARSAELHIFDKDSKKTESANVSQVVCALVDNGHGMNRQEFEEKWLTVGTESKAIGNEIKEEDKCGLDEERPKQGQKGIGRLSSAALGSLLMLVSKREGQPYVVALIDWRLFENPFLLLQDISIPVAEFELAEDLFDLQADLFETLMGNLWGDGKDVHRDQRINEAWSLHEEHERSNTPNRAKGWKSTKSKIEETVIENSFSRRHFNVWPVWTEQYQHGTAMFISNVHDDIESLLIHGSLSENDGYQVRAVENFWQKLLAFSIEKKYSFSPSITTWKGARQHEFVGENSDIDPNLFNKLEHLIDGEVDDRGFFSGTVKVFGKLKRNVRIEPLVEHKTQSNTKFGAFHIRIGAFEVTKGMTSLSDEVSAKVIDAAEKFSGLRIYRDGLRVLPYGVVSNDFFEIEKRRTLNAGRYFWSFRRMFGAIFITREENPNLKDKAGREGFLDNKASKLFKEIVDNILVVSADQYFGSKSEIRKPIVNAIKAEREKKKFSEDRKKVLVKAMTALKKELKLNYDPLVILLKEADELAKSFEKGVFLESKESALSAKKMIGFLTVRRSELVITTIVPDKLGNLESPYKKFRLVESDLDTVLKQLNLSVNSALGRLSKNEAYETAKTIYEEKSVQLSDRVKLLSSKGRKVLQEEQSGFLGLVDQCISSYKDAVIPYLERLRKNEEELQEVLAKLDSEYQKVEIENEQRLVPYITGLENIKNQIDIEGLAIHSLNEVQKSRDEIDRLHQLAQLGITVEIIGHEIEGLDATITRGLKSIKNAKFTNAEADAFTHISHAQEELTDRWRFLSPLKLSGDRQTKEISGNDIFKYVGKFFDSSFEDNEIIFAASNQFKKIKFYEQPARIFPVFVNLVNNSRYWVKQSKEPERKIRLDVLDQEVVVADNGPGVARIDYDQLFTLFFTRKQRGGRGIGLYLCKQNLAAGGHSIRYETNADRVVLPGANFKIDIRGVSGD